MDLDFARASLYVSTSVDTSFIKDDATRLKFYSLFKQGMNGDVQGNRPTMFSPVDRAKFDAWARHRGMSRATAKSEYVKQLDSVRPAWRKG